MFRALRACCSALLVPAALLVAFPVAAQLSPPRYSCTALPVLSPSLEEQIRIAEANVRSTQPLFALAANLETGSEGHDVNWVLAAQAHKVVMERTGNLPDTSLGARTWEASADALIRMYQQGLYGLGIDYAEVYRIIRLKEARGLPVADDNAKTRRLEAGYRDLISGLDAFRFGDLDSALRHYQRAGEAGIAIANTEAGVLYFKMGAYDQAKSWFDRSYSESEPEAFYYLGNMYSTGGRGLAADPAKGVNYLYNAAVRGHVLGMHGMGGAFESGTGLSRSNLNEAMCWYRRALKYSNDYDGMREVIRENIAGLNAKGIR